MCELSNRGPLKHLLNKNNGRPESLDAFCEFFGVPPVGLDRADPYEAVIASLGGRSFGRGAFKVFCASDLSKWDEIAKALFTALEDELKVFGYDWMGRIFGLDMREGPDFGTVVLMDASIVRYYSTGRGLLGFLNEEIPCHSEACLEMRAYEEWVASHGTVPLLECAGYRVPMFLGGNEEVSNMGLLDMEVYWDITTQLWQLARELPDGTKIGNVTLE